MEFIHSSKTDYICWKLLTFQRLKCICWNLLTLQRLSIFDGFIHSSKTEFTLHSSKTEYI